MTAQRVRQQSAKGAVIDGPGSGRAAVIAFQQAHIGGQYTRPHRLLGQQANKLLTVNVLQLSVVVLRRQLLVNLVIEAVHREMVSRDVAGITLVFAVQPQVLGVGGVPRGVAVQTRSHELQVFDFLRLQHRAVEDVGQQTAVVVLEQRQVRQQGAVFEYGLGNTHFGGQATFGVLIFGTTRIAAGRRQQAAVTVGRAGVQLDPQHAQRIEAKADGAFGVARLQVEEKALRRLVALGSALRA